MSFKVISNYATALFEIAKKNNEIEEITDQIYKVNKAFAQNINHIRNYPGQTKELVKKSNLNIFVKNFILLVIKNHKLNHLKDIVNKYTKLFCEYKNYKNVILTFASPPTESEKKALVDLIEKNTNCTIQLKTKYDASILGGVVIDIENIRIQASYKHLLNQITEAKDTMLLTISSQLNKIYLENL